MVAKRANCATIHGATRTTWGSTPTSYQPAPAAKSPGFTGQRNDAAIGLYYYHARDYDPALGRFIQADTVVPSAGKPQALNRYAYTLGNPVRYTDPSGHYSTQSYIYATGQSRELAQVARFVQFAGAWNSKFRAAVRRGARAVAGRLTSVARTDHAQAMSRAARTGENPAAFTSQLSSLWGLSEHETFRAVYGTVTLRRIAGNPIKGWAETHLDWAGNGCNRGQICYDESIFTPNRGNFVIMQNVAHELGHGLDQRGGRRARADLAAAWGVTPVLKRGTGQGFAPGGGWQQNRSPGAGEVFADMFLGWTFDSWEANTAGAVRSQYMQTYMPGIMALAVTAN